MKDCVDIRKEFGIDVRCCNSCHADEMMGYASLVEIWNDFAGWPGPSEPGKPKMVAIVCCAIYNELVGRSESTEGGTP